MTKTVGKTNKITLLTVRIIFFLVFLELLLRVSGLFQTQTEQYDGEYRPFFTNMGDSWFHSWTPNTVIDYQTEDFAYLNTINELGHRESPYKDFNVDSNSLKIICIGDSFTEGDGAPYDSSWVRFFELDLANYLDTPVHAYNAGVCGSDVVYSYIMLKEKLLKSKPAIVFECLNSSDLTDVYYSGGMERFGENGELLSPNQKWWEPIYQRIHIFRLLLNVFVGYDTNLINQRKEELDEIKSIELIASQVQTTYALCKENNIPYYLVFMPEPGEIERREITPFNNFPEQLPQNFPILNIYPSQYKTYDTLHILDYSWERNGHFNSKGYEQMSKSIIETYKSFKREELGL